MKNYKNSDYSLNKKSDGIVYKFADGSTYTLTLADYLSHNPRKTEADFSALKALSDADYLERDRSGYRQTLKDVSIHRLEGTTDCAAPSLEDVVIEQPEQNARRKLRRELGQQALDTLTEVQRRRYLMHNFSGLTTQQIAVKEGITQQAVSKSLLAAKNKIMQFMVNG